MSIESVQDMSDGDLAIAITELLEEKLRRSVENGDPDTLIRTALEDMFDSSGPKPPKIVSKGIVAVPGYIKDTAAEKHSCKVFTVRMPDGESELWAWEADCATIIHGETEKVGKVRSSVSLHQAIDGLVLIEHSMKMADRRHSRSATRAWQVEVDVNEETGEIVSEKLVMLSSFTPSRLPPPPGETDTRAYG